MSSTVMTEFTLEKARRYYRQLAPHAKGREGGQIIEALITELAAAKEKYKAFRDARIVILEALECVETERNVLKNRLAEIEKAAELPYDDRQVISSIGNDGSIEYVAAYAELRTHALHLAAENARLRDDAERWQYGINNGFPYQSRPASTNIAPCWYYVIGGLATSFASPNEAIDAARKGKA